LDVLDLIAQQLQIVHVLDVEKNNIAVLVAKNWIEKYINHYV
jgi:hypothetical protein